MVASDLLNWRYPDGDWIGELRENKRGDKDLGIIGHILVAAIFMKLTQRGCLEKCKRAKDKISIFECGNEAKSEANKRNRNSIFR